MCQLVAVEERAVACIGRLLAFSNTCSLPKVCSCFTGAVVLRHQCTENQRFPVLGKLAGQLILCCTSTDEGTRDEAMKAVHQLFIFIASQRMWLWQKDPKKQQLRERWQILFYEHISQENNASKIFMMFLKYLQYPERVSIFLTAIESMTAPSLHSTELAAHMVDVLAAEAHFPPGQVGTCCCHSSSPRGAAGVCSAPRHGAGVPVPLPPWDGSMESSSGTGPGLGPCKPRSKNEEEKEKCYRYRCGGLDVLGRLV
ncbi:uncharacterized protein LOC104913139 [Meleagris gallopavo]|uniref:uncharacterized protein LOC104913139 n=1 Tax=Meleagris gallopavo TaxID=9103 RepID=UPI00093A1239|nr:uncharacterized protein LOC104913139 [Meleagris gallopavo]